MSPPPGSKPGDLPYGAFHALFEASPAPMWLYDAKIGRVLAANRRALDCFGRLEQFPPTSPAKEGAGDVLRHRRPDGTVVALRLDTVRVDLAGRAACLVVAADVTEESRALAESERQRIESIASESALRKTERRFRQLFETASDWYWETDAQGYLTFVSPNFEVMFGMKPEAYIRKRLNDVAEVKIDAQSAQKALAAIKAQRPYRDFEYTLTLPDGRAVIVTTSAVPMFDDDGRFCGYCGVSKDITARVGAEHALRESERQFKQVLEAAADYYWEQDEQYRTTYLSPGYEKLDDRPIAQMIGTRLTDYPEASVDIEMGRMVLVAQKEKKPYRDFIYSMKTRDGRKRWFKSSGAPVFDRNGSFNGYRGVAAEITRQVEAETAARVAQQQLNEAVTHVTQPTVVYDAADLVVAFNQAFFDLHRVADGDYARAGKGLPFRALAEWELRHDFYAAGPDDPKLDLETLLARYHSEDEHTYRLRDGRWMLVVYRRLPGHGRVGLWTDVTALKQAEADRRLLERQVHHSQRLEALGTLAGGVAHEINNALVPVVALTKMVVRKLPEESRERRNLETVLTGAERSRDLVKQILAFGRKEEQERRQDSVDMGAVLSEALRLMRATLPASIRFEEEIAAVPVVIGDANQLHQVIVNIITNAAQAIGAVQGKIALRLRPESGGASLRLSIADTGCGMDEATLARIFEPFFTTKQVGEGTGLGLSVAHGIVKNHGGRIEVASKPGEGTRFDIILPTAQAAAGAAA
jgi:PAS domain S-box-containing protein